VRHVLFGTPDPGPALVDHRAGHGRHRDQLPDPLYLGVAAPTMMADLGITTEQYSWITGAFQLGIMLQPVAGYILDLVGLRTGLALFAAAWALITMAHGLA
jgi:MFS family permease